MRDRPSALELLEAVNEFLADEVLPLMDDHRMKFRTLVALNALGIAYREVAAGPDDEGPSEEELRALARRIRGGDVPPGTRTFLKEHVAAKLRISNPRYLEKYE
jgi:Domain of unknown function (DUF6285)